jgi:CpXC protein
VKITGSIAVRCAHCGVNQKYQLVQSINAETDPAAKARLLSGACNVAVCVCGKRSQLAANVVFHDPATGLLCHVCPDGEAAMKRAEAAFDASFSPSFAPSTARETRRSEVQRIVPSLNALVEKIKIFDAGLQDWTLEMTKVALLASISIEDDDRVLLFARVDDDRATIHWLLFDRYGEAPVSVSSSLAGYHRMLATSADAPLPSQRRIDRAWAIDAVRTMIGRAN